MQTKQPEYQSKVATNSIYAMRLKESWRLKIKITQAIDCTVNHRYRLIRVCGEKDRARETDVFPFEALLLWKMALCNSCN